MTEAAKRFFYLIVLLVVGSSALGSVQSTNSTTTQDSAASAKRSATTMLPGVNADASGVMFFSNDQVAQTFVKGAVLYNGNPERNYRVHIFHRDKPGEVEIHTKDADILYILEGSAIFATGGTVTDGKETGPGEIRAVSMNGGVVRTLTKGDVIIVPANVPHWFTGIQKPITYFGVKVR